MDVWTAKNVKNVKNSGNRILVILLQLMRTGIRLPASLLHSRSRDWVGKHGHSQRRYATEHLTLTEEEHAVEAGLELRWVARRISELLPTWYKKRLTCMSMGAGDGMQDANLSALLTHEHECDIMDYVLLEADKSLAELGNNQDHLLALHPGVMPRRVDADAVGQLAFDDPVMVSLYLDSLHRWESKAAMMALQQTTFGARGAALTFITGNAREGFYTAKDGIIEMLCSMLAARKQFVVRKEIVTSRVPYHVLTEEFISAAVHPKSVKEVLSVWNKLKKRKAAGETLTKEEEMVKVQDSLCCMISALTKDETFDPLLRWKAAGFGPGYD